MTMYFTILDFKLDLETLHKSNFYWDSLSSKDQELIELCWNGFVHESLSKNFQISALD